GRRIASAVGRARAAHAGRESTAARIELSHDPSRVLEHPGVAVAVVVPVQDAVAGIEREQVVYATAAPGAAVGDDEVAPVVADVAEVGRAVGQAGYQRAVLRVGASREEHEVS